MADAHIQRQKPAARGIRARAQLLVELFAGIELAPVGLELDSGELGGVATEEELERAEVADLIELALWVLSASARALGGRGP